MTTRPSPERLASIRAHLDRVLTAHAFWGGEPAETMLVVRDLVAEVDALRAERDSEKARADYALMDRDAIDTMRCELRDAVARVMTLCAGHRGKDWCEQVLGALKGVDGALQPEPWREALERLLATCRDAKLYDVMLVVRTLNEDADEYSDPRFNIAPLWRALSAMLGAAYSAEHPFKKRETP